MPTPAPQLYLIRHAETEWALSGRHTGRTDIPLTERGRLVAVSLGNRLAGRQFSLVLCSPLQRAIETCGLAGYGEVAELREELQEWDYGEYEGLTTPEIRARRPGWDLWRDGSPGGETAAGVAARARHVLEEAAAAGGDVAIFAHGHLLRVLASCWLGLEPEGGALLALAPGSISTLGHERERRVLTGWNDTVRMA
jgi:broad specificity phosphatase PhoE